MACSNNTNIGFEKQIWDARKTAKVFLGDFLAGKITRQQFWVLAEFRHPTHQISFHTLTALNCLAFEQSEVAYDR